jgi:hypothetical protein
MTIKDAFEVGKKRGDGLVWLEKSEGIMEG